MSGSGDAPPEVAPLREHLTLLMAGDAPSSARARARLKAVLKTMGLSEVIVEEVDVLRTPAVALKYRVFATPALVCVRDDVGGEVLYGDLSDPEPLRQFLERHA